MVEMFNFLTRGDVVCRDDNKGNRFLNPYWIIESDGLRTAGYQSVVEAINVHLTVLEEEKR
jgi:hypothetical protein